ncbi:hypothetical protein [Ferrimonas marina]|uniref:Uncharacterized protein n=1 Tax=Ferrimonas marina TaxID=299255 RepID=A0A1M5XDA7_9GAMM|nr:hypothetical protein [Ferrimonas marina]SHH97749.1 hypothetical protein SAMN02745129_3449 [Ferrimonas marina]
MQLVTIVILFVLAAVVVGFLLIPRKRKHKEVVPIANHARKRKPRKRRGAQSRPA